MRLNWWHWFHSPPYQPGRAARRSPYDLSTWGAECARGAPYATTGAPVAAGTPGVRRTISTGRKARGSSSADLARQEQRKGGTAA